MFLVLAAGYLLLRRAELLRRRRRTWDAIVERFQPGLGAGRNVAVELDSRFSAEEIEARAATSEGRKRMFREAGALLEMADFAEQNGAAEVAPVAANLRAHATAIRVEAAKKLLGMGGRRS